MNIEDSPKIKYLQTPILSQVTPKELEEYKNNLLIINTIPNIKKDKFIPERPGIYIDSSKDNINYVKWYLQCGINYSKKFKNSIDNVLIIYNNPETLKNYINILSSCKKPTKYCLKLGNEEIIKETLLLEKKATNFYKITYLDNVVL